MGAVPVSQSQSRQLLSAEPVSTCRVSPRSPVKEHQRVCSPQKLFRYPESIYTRGQKGALQREIAEIEQIPLQEWQSSSMDSESQCSYYKTHSFPPEMVRKRLKRLQSSP